MKEDDDKRLKEGEAPAVCSATNWTPLQRSRLQHLWKCDSTKIWMPLLTKIFKNVTSPKIWIQCWPRLSKVWFHKNLDAIVDQDFQKCDFTKNLDASSDQSFQKCDSTKIWIQCWPILSKNVTPPKDFTGYKPPECSPSQLASDRVHFLRCELLPPTCEAWWSSSLWLFWLLSLITLMEAQYVKITMLIILNWSQPKPN